MPVITPLVLAVHAPTAGEVARQPPAEAQRCSGALTLTGDGVGAVRVGAPVAAVRKACDISAIKQNKGDSSPTADLLELKIGGAPVRAEISGGRVWRVLVDDRSLRTVDKLGVGSPLSALLASGPARASEIEGVIYATTARHCGVSFALSYRPRRGEDRDSWTAEGLARLPPDTKVERVMMAGCKAG
jgi:hypothetical protein